MNKFLLSIPLLGALLTFPTLFGMNPNNNPGTPTPPLVQSFLSNQRKIYAGLAVLGAAASLARSKPFTLILKQNYLPNIPIIPELTTAMFGWFLTTLATELTSLGAKLAKDTHKNQEKLSPQIAGGRYIVGVGGGILAALAGAAIATDSGRMGGYLFLKGLKALYSTINNLQQASNAIA